MPSLVQSIGIGIDFKNKKLFGYEADKKKDPEGSFFLSAFTEIVLVISGY